MAAIWWLNPDDITEILGTPSLKRMIRRMPAYVGRELHSMKGRAGRGRLWLSDDPNLMTELGKWNGVTRWPKGALGQRLEGYGGLVVRDIDADALHAMPGILTTLRVRRLSEPITASEVGQSTPA